jgi:hypothetical protein
METDDKISSVEAVLASSKSENAKTAAGHVEDRECERYGK